MVLIDAHSHLFEIKNYDLPPDMLAVVVGYSQSSNKKAAEYGKKGFPFVLGIAPQTAVKEGIDRLDEWVAFIRENRPNAIGEIGLDYKWALDRKHVEKERLVFTRMLELADEMDLPVVIHSRNKPNKETNPEVPYDAVGEVVELVGSRRFLMHFYSGDETQAASIVDRGGYISVTHMRSKDRRKVINAVPVERLLVESDSPYVGRTPESIREAIAYIAEIKELDFNTVAAKTAENTMRFFNFKV